MPGPILPPFTDLKKNYKFVWYIGNDNPSEGGLPYEVLPKFSLLMNHVLTSYVSQMAETVALPDDEIEVKDYQIGCVEMPVATKFKMPPIVVTYLDDTNDSVYNFHKSWQSFIRKGDTFCMEPLYPYCIMGRFMTFENTLTAEEHIAMLAANEKISKAANSSAVARVVENLMTDTDLFVKPRSIYNYPHIFPVSIKRDNANKGGSELSKVTVTYRRIPEIKKRQAYMNLNRNYDMFVHGPHNRAIAATAGLNQLVNVVKSIGQ